MSATTAHEAVPASALDKCPTGIPGLDEITGGGLPTGRSTLVIGNPGCGKSLLGLEFLVRGITQYGEPGLLMTFEETAEEVTQNVSSLGWDLDAMRAENRLAIDHVRIDPYEIEETGDYDLEGLFVRLGAAIDAVGAKRVVLDTIEVLFSGFKDTALVRAELRRLLRWLKERGVTGVFTGELDASGNTRYGIEAYVSDCVILLDHRVDGQVSTRRLRVVKYRGSRHGTNEYPFAIGVRGFEVLPITSLVLDVPALEERISTGIPRLDTMLGGQGLYRGSSVLISGGAGTGKTSLAAYLADAACRRGERALYISFEESPAQVQRNMRSIGLDLGHWQGQGLLLLQARRATSQGLESLLMDIHGLVGSHCPRLVVLDPIANLIRGGDLLNVQGLLARLLDYLKQGSITLVLTDFNHGGDEPQTTETAVSSLIDTWLSLRFVESGGERNRVLSVLKSRGMVHSNQMREFRLSDRGIELVDVYLGSEGLLTGSARYTQESRERAEADGQRQALARDHDALVRKRAVAAARIELIRAELAEEEAAMARRIAQTEQAIGLAGEERDAMRGYRSADIDRPGETA